MYTTASKLRHMLLVASILTALSLAVHGQGTKMPPEVKKTVDAFRGHWVLTGTDNEPSFKAPAPLTVTIDCQPAALSAAVNCHIAGNLPGGGHVEAATVIGYSPDEQVVRWMEISSSGEYHDHKGPWMGNEIQFEPLAYSVSGEKATEYLTLGFPSPSKITLKSITETADGKFTWDLTGTRLSSSSTSR